MASRRAIASGGIVTSAAARVASSCSGEVAPTRVAPSKSRVSVHATAKVGSAMPHGTTFTEGDDYANIVSSFSVWYVAMIYIVALGLVGLHLWHGVWSATVSLGLRHPRYNGPLRALAIGVTLLITVGMLSIPVSVLAGWVD